MRDDTTATPFLWYEAGAEDAASLYTSLLPNSAITAVERAGPDGPAFLVAFTLTGRSYVAMNGGPGRPHTEAFSISVSCESQEEIDRLWDALTANGGAPGHGGWLRDRWGLSWQITPAALPRLIGEASETGRARLMALLRGSGKFDIAALEAAAMS